MFVNAEQFLKQAEAKAAGQCSGQAEKQADVPRPLQAAMTLLRAAEEVATELRGQYTLIQQLKGEVAFLRDVNQHLAQQAVDHMRDKDQTEPACPECDGPCEGSVRIITEGHVPAETKALLASLVAFLNIKQ